MAINKIKTVFRCTLKLLTPLHVGSGEKLQHGFDFVRHDDIIHVLSSSKMFAAVRELGLDKINTFTNAIEEKTLEEWLRENGVRPKSISSHSFPYREQNPPNMIHAHIRDGMANPIVPGSSLKGALRTAIIRKLARVNGTLMKKTISNLSNPKGPRPKAKEADKILLQKLLGNDPNINLLRVLTVGDFSFSPQDLDLHAVLVYRLEIPTGTQLNRKKNNGGRVMAPIWVENLSEKAASSSVLSFDDFLAKAGSEQKKYLETKDTIDLPWLLGACRDLTLHTIETELTFLQGKTGTPVDELRVFYTTLQKDLDNLKDMEAIIQMGWGSGWRGMTGQLLEADDLTDNLRLPLELAKKYIGFPFPKSRRIVSNNGEVLPMGWIKLSFTPMDKVRKEEREIQQQILIGKEKLNQAKIAEMALIAQWEAMGEAERDLACIRQDAIALKFAPGDANDPNQTIWKRLDAAPPEHKKQLAMAFKERWEKDGRWNVRKKSSKQSEKIGLVKEILKLD